jgi:chromosome segregation ATPase
MFITRLQCEEGFLDDVDLAFDPGLNVIIGPRGAGKTSVVELIRYCLNVPAYSKQTASSAREHALSILGSGRVTVTLNVDGESVLVSRTAEDERPRWSKEVAVRPPVVLSQNEIEQIGLQAGGRLRLVDGFRGPAGSFTAEEATLRSAISSMTVEMASASAELRELEDVVARKVALSEQLAMALAEQAGFDASLSELVEERERLAAISNRLAESERLQEVLERTIEAARQWLRGLESVGDRPPVPSGVPENSTTAGISLARTELSRSAELLHQAQDAAAEGVRQLEAVEVQNRTGVLELQDESRSLRRSLEAASEGAGTAARRVSELQSELGRIEGVQQAAAVIKSELDLLRTRRGALLDQLDELRGRRVAERQAVIESLNESFGPQLHFELQAFAAQAGYSAALAAALQGTGLHYNTLAPQIAAAVSPRELAELAENFGTDELAELAGISRERASRVVSALIASGVEEVLSAQVDDAVELSLLDGSEYKASTHLSTGQRCTIVLPILLRHEDRILVVDQPEDHLDNAFVVDTVVRAMRERGTGAQLICTTHNPNIPVLGEASKVIMMGSDGRRGFERLSGGLDQPSVVEAITSVMEGGRQAFQRRAAFYDL